MRLNEAQLRGWARAALAEDRAGHDITTRDFVPAGLRCEAVFMAKQTGVLCGCSVVKAVLKAFDPRLHFQVLKKEGSRVKSGDSLARVEGRARSILSCERVSLNFLSHLSGIATQTAQVVETAQAAGIRILDTRKTTPFLRILEKYAVATGGGTNHRMDLADQYLVKDNHMAILQKAGTLESLNKRRPGVVFEIEVDGLTDLADVLPLNPDIIMLDNFSPAQIRQALQLLQRAYPQGSRRPKIELSGGITPANISRYCIRGVDFISLGFLTHSVRALDISLEMSV